MIPDTARSPRVHGEPLELGHDVAREEHGALLFLVERGVVLDRLEDVHIRWMNGRAVRVPEESDELVAEDVHVCGHERGGHAPLRR